MRALIIGGGIGGLSTAIGLQRVGIEAIVFEKAAEITEVGAGSSLWSNAILAARRLGAESELVAAGSVSNDTRSSMPSGKPLDEFDLSALTRKVGALTLCVHRAELQRILRDAVLTLNLDSVQTGRKCIGCDEKDGVVSAVFADGSRERGYVLIGADGIHSVVRRSLFGDEKPRYAGYYAWSGVAHGVSELLQAGQSLFIVGTSTQAGCFHCGKDQVYWFLTCNGPPHLQPGPGGNREGNFRARRRLANAYAAVC